MNNRDPYFDNLKGTLIFLVVFGHFVNLNRAVPSIGAISNVIYSFHMPVFVFISGYFSKNVTSQRTKEIYLLLFPYVIFQVLNYVFTKSTGFGEGTGNIFIPAYQNWYLLALFFWRTSAPYFSKFSGASSLTVSVILAFTVGFYSEFNAFLALYRTLYFLPVFLAGYYCIDLRAVLDRYSRYRHLIILAAVGLMGVIAALSLLNTTFNDQISYAFTPYSNYGGSSSQFYIRVAGFASSLLISSGIFFLIPRQQRRFTFIGENAMNIFLAHMFIVFPAAYYVRHLHPLLMVTTGAVLSVMICMIFSSKLSARLFRPITRRDKLTGMQKKFPVIQDAYPTK